MDTNTIMYYDVTYHCNLNCRFCVSEKTNNPSNKDYQANDYKSTFDLIDKCSTLILSGGEPTLFPELINLCEYARPRFEKIILSSNGMSFFELDFAKRIVSSGIDLIIVPFFTTKSDLYDELVSCKGGFVKLVEGLHIISSLCKESTTKLLLKILPMTPGLPDVPFIPKFLKNQEIEPSYLQVSGLHVGGRLINNLEIIPDERMLSDAVSSLIEKLPPIPFSIIDLPLCILKEDALIKYIEQGSLTYWNEYNYFKANQEGIRIGKRKRSLFKACDRCGLINICSGYFPNNLDLIESKIGKLVRTIGFG